MAKDQDKGGGRKGGKAATSGTGKDPAAEAAGGQHHAAAAHGRPATVDTSLPDNRPALMELHAAARARRNAAPLGSDAFRLAVEELARIEVRIASIDRAAEPSLG